MPAPANNYVLLFLASVDRSPCAAGIVGRPLPDGGFGFLTPKHGLSIDNLLEVELVKTDGSVVTVSEETDRELFWGIRGAGWRFGVATRFKLRLHPLQVFQGDKHGHAGYAMWDMEHARVVLNRFLSLTVESRLPTDAMPMLAFANRPELDGRMGVVLQHAWIGDPARGDTWLRQEFLELARPAFCEVAAMDYLGIQRVPLRIFPAQQRYYMRSRYLRNDKVLDDPAAFADKLLPYVEAHKPSNVTVALVRLGDAAERVPPDATAYSMRQCKYLMLIWESVPFREPEDRPELLERFEVGREFVRSMVWDFLEKECLTCGYYQNMSMEDDGKAAAKDARSPEETRLRALVAKHDPKVMLCHVH
eukprot:jgi/Mesvir1/26974/Mv20687-RA.2